MGLRQLNERGVEKRDGSKAGKVSSRLVKIRGRETGEPWATTRCGEIRHYNS